MDYQVKHNIQFDELGVHAKKECMNQDNNINKIIKKLCKEIFPDDVFQKGNSRVYLDDNGYYFTMIEFQPYSFKKGTFLNAGLSFFFNKNDYLSFSYAYNNDSRIGKTFIEYTDDEQFEKDVRKYVELAKDYILKYRAFADMDYAKQYIIKDLNDDNWNPYIKSMLCFLTDDAENGQKYYKMFLDNPFFERIINEHHYPKCSKEINKAYVMNMINEQRRLWHSKSSMKKMKIIDKFE